MVIPTLQPTATPTFALPTLKMKLYRNERLGFEFKYVEGYEVMEETTNMVSFNFVSHRLSYLTISTNEITNYKSYMPCKYSDDANKQTFPCLESGERWWQKGDIIETTLGQVEAKSFYIAEGFPDAGYHIVQSNGSPKFEAKMFVSGAGLDSSFKQMLATFKFLDNR
jgi:hypothetical protein